MSIDRRQSIVEASDTVQLAVEYSGDISSGHHAKVVGIDLSGDPQVLYRNRLAVYSLYLQQLTAE